MLTSSTVQQHKWKKLRLLLPRKNLKFSRGVCLRVKLCGYSPSYMWVGYKDRPGISLCQLLHILDGEFALQPWNRLLDPWHNRQHSYLQLCRSFYRRHAAKKHIWNRFDQWWLSIKCPIHTCSSEPAESIPEACSRYYYFFMKELHVLNLSLSLWPEADTRLSRPS